MDMTIRLRSTKNIWDSSIDFNYVNYAFLILAKILHNVSCANQHALQFLTVQASISISTPVYLSFLAKSSWEPHSAILSYFPSETSPQRCFRTLFQVKVLCCLDGNRIARILVMGFISETAGPVFHLRSCFQTAACWRCRSRSIP